MKIRNIAIDEDECPESVTVVMSIAEAAAIAHIFGKLSPVEQEPVVRENLDEVYSGLVGGLFNRFWEDGLNDYLNGAVEGVTAVDLTVIKARIELADASGIARIAVMVSDIDALVARVETAEQERNAAEANADEAECEAENQRGNAIIERRRAESAEARLAKVQEMAGRWRELAAVAIDPQSREWVGAASRSLDEALCGDPARHVHPTVVATCQCPVGVGVRTYR